jgi:hypothetical protein
MWPLTVAADDDISIDWPDDSSSEIGVLRITLMLPTGRKLPAETKVSVRLDDDWEELSRLESEPVYEKKLKQGQSYLVRVIAPTYRMIEHTVALIARRISAVWYLIPQDWPFYLMGGVEIPVMPRPRLAAVAIAKPINDDITKLIEQADKLGFRRVTKDLETGEQLDQVHGSVFYFEPKDPDVSLFSFNIDKFISPLPVELLRNLFAPYGGRVGTLAKAQKGSVRILGSQYLIRFPKPLTNAEVKEYASKLRAVVLRLSDPKAGFWLIEFTDPQNIARHLDIIAQEVKSRKLVSGEPNLLFQLSTHACYSPAITNPWDTCQAHLSRQRVYDAWCYIGQHVPNVNPQGSAAIRVATLDDGITYSSATRSSIHPNVETSMIGFCYDLFADTPCTGTPPASVHGMASYGIISAKPDAARGIRGIASNVTHIPIAHASIWNSELYAQTLLWLGGIRLSAPDGKNAACPIPPADIISCSHSLEGDPVPDSVDSALKQLTCEGRGGLGTVLVYSAGNEDRPMSSSNELATHPHTIGVGDTQFANGNETRWVNPAASPQEGSNYSDQLLICANGEAAPSLLPTPTDNAGWSCNGVTTDMGVFPFGGTSAAAPMVAAAAALVLSVNPWLNWDQVRTVLCASAEKIDCGNTDANGEWVWRGPSPTRTPPNPCTSLPRGLKWFSQWYGYGRLDVYHAVKAAHKLIPKSAPACVPY